MQAQLGIDSTEVILESFNCSLAQTYAAQNNSFTPDREVRVLGTRSHDHAVTCEILQQLVWRRWNPCLPL